jgi:hypothetical protein
VAFSSKANFFYAIDGSILSGAEVGVCMIVGSLPPLRKQFDKFLKIILPKNLMESKISNPSFVIPIFSTKGSQAISGTTGDDDSAIFNTEGDLEGNQSCNMKTPQLMVENRRENHGPTS